VQERPDPVPGTGEVLVAATHAGLNPADLSQRAGNYPAPPGSPKDVPGLEVAGRVVACGPGVNRWSVGDRVFGIVGGGGLADRVAVHELHLAPVPERLDDREAAAAPEAFITAHDAVVTQAGLQSGELLLVNGASGGVGSAAVQIGLAMGARVLAGVRSPEAAERLRSLGADPVDTASTVERARDGGGADVILELIGGPNLAMNLDAAGRKGRLMIVGVNAGPEAELSLRTLMSKRLRMTGTMLRARPLHEKALAVSAFERSVVPLLATGAVRAYVDRVFPVDEAVAAFDHLAAPGKFGKVLVEF
jgi:putative PIG3 family NAD(P)H quinone oxidoreductase